MLVTNAELIVLTSDLKIADMENGKARFPPSGRSVDFLILKHPFPTPESLDRDFRDAQNPTPSSEYWGQVHKESIYVVRSTALAKFLASEHRDYLRLVMNEG